MNDADFKKIEKLLDSKFKTVITKFENLDAKVNDALDSLSFLSQKYDDLIKEVSQFKQENQELKKQVAFLTNNLMETTKGFNVIKEAQDDLEQYGRRDCLEFRGIPQVAGEDINDIVINIAEKVGVNWKKKMYQLAIACQ